MRKINADDTLSQHKSIIVKKNKKIRAFDKIKSSDGSLEREDLVKIEEVKSPVVKVAR